MSVSDQYEMIDKRQSRIEDAIERLTVISGDLNKMIAVHEQRISQQEKQLTTVELLAERRREEVDDKFADVSRKIEELKHYIGVLKRANESKLKN